MKQVQCMLHCTCMYSPCYIRTHPKDGAAVLDMQVLGTNACYISV